MLTDSVSDDGLWVHRPLSYGVLMWCKGGLWDGFYKGANPIHEGSSLVI